MYPQDPRSSSIFSAFLVLIVCCATAVRAQKADHAASAMPPGLRQIVQIDRNGATVKQVLAALSAQCGVTITAEDYLEDRILTLHLEKMPAVDALDTLIEGNDWKWYAENDTTVRVTRPRIPTPHNLSEVPAAFRAALPKEMRRYLGYDVPPRDLLTEAMKGHYGEGSVSNMKDKRPGAAFRAFQERGAVSAAAFGLSRRLYVARGKQPLPFEKMIADENRIKVKIPYAELTAEQKQNLVSLMVCEALSRFSGSPTVYHFLHVPMPPECYDPAKAVIGIKDNSICIGPYLNGRIYGLEETIHSTPPMIDPLRVILGRY